MVNIMAASTQAKGSFSPINGSKVRRVFNEHEMFLGTITKLDDGSGYRVFRLKDGKIRTKRYLADAFKSIRRDN
jgi:hypothetical protein